MSSYTELWGHQEYEPWNEKEAIRLLQEAAAEVLVYAEGGARMSDRQHYHARIQTAHEAKNMEAYREVLNGYVEAAREACRQKKKKSARRKDV